MSVMMASDYHFSVLASYAEQNDVYYTYRGIMRQVKAGSCVNHIVSVLYLANEASWEARYSETIVVSEPRPNIKTIPTSKMLPPLVIIKSCQFLAYQCSEVDDYEGTECHAILTAIINKAATKLPGWEDAPWGL